jgi:hypothetical protein
VFYLHPVHKSGLFAWIGGKGSIDGWQSKPASVQRRQRTRRLRPRSMKQPQSGRSWLTGLADNRKKQRRNLAGFTEAGRSYSTDAQMRPFSFGGTAPWRPCRYGAEEIGFAPSVPRSISGTGTHSAGFGAERRALVRATERSSPTLLGAKSRQFLLSERCASMANCPRKTPAEI